MSLEHESQGLSKMVGSKKLKLSVYIF